MAKNKNNGGRSTNATGNSGGLMDGLGNVPDTLKKYGNTAAKAVGNLSTTQKVIGGALLVLGAGYLSSRAGLLKNVGRLATAAMALTGKNKGGK